MDFAEAAEEAEENLVSSQRIKTRFSTKIMVPEDEPVSPFTAKYLKEKAPKFSTLHVNFIFGKECEYY